LYKNKRIKLSHKIIDFHQLKLLETDQLISNSVSNVGMHQSSTSVLSLVEN